MIVEDDKGDMVVTSTSSFLAKGARLLEAGLKSSYRDTDIVYVNTELKSSSPIF